MLLGAVGDAALADPGDDVLVDDVAGDPAAGLVLDRADPGRHALLHVRLAALRHAHEEPRDAERVLVVDRHAPFEMAAEIKPVRPQRDAPDGPVAILLALAFAHALVDEAVVELLELELEMLRRDVGIAAAHAGAPIVVHPFEVHRIDGVLLALKPVARHVGEHDLAKAVAPGERLPHRQFRRRQRAQIGEQQAGAFLDRIGLGLAAGLRRFRTGGVLVGLFEAAAGLVHQPAVIAAADAGLLDPAIGHVGAAVRTVAVDQAVPAAAVAVEHEVLAHQADGLDRVGIELAGAGDRLPVAAQQFAHRRAGSDAGEHFVAGGGEQAFLAGWPVSAGDYFTTGRGSGRG